VSEAGREPRGAGERQDRLERVQGALGYRFRRPELLAQALRHASAAHEQGVPSNERLEFLGDAALSHAAAMLLFTSWPAASEGQLTRGRAALVRERTLAEVARQLGIGEALEVSLRFRLGDAVLADACEAVLGALLVDGGWRRFSTTVRRLFLPLLVTLDPGELSLEEPKSMLQELAQRQGLALPVYRQVSVEGPEHRRLYTFEVEFAGRVAGRGSGSSKRAAQQEAARAALALLGAEGEPLEAGAAPGHS